jgi:hypothetical protein
MSVINKMLRDLDQRKGDSAAQAVVEAAPLRQGTAAIGGMAGASVQRRIPALAGLLSIVLLGAAVWAAWWALHQPTAGNAAPAAPVPTPATAAAMPAPATAPMPVAATVAVPVAAASPASAPVAAGVASEVIPFAAVASPPEPVSAPVTPVEKSVPYSGLRMETRLAPRKPTERMPTAGATPPESALANVESPKAVAGNDALQRAQSLWNAGSREAAIDWLQEAIAVAERNGAPPAGPSGNPVLLPLVRELTRMQLAEARFSAVWDLLSRLEPQLGTVPDLWAIRGNAAQRLGRHQDSVHSYMVALQSRPDEQRWLLAAAVSLAALGQITSATEMAEKARAVGVVSKDVLAYLRQLGVVLKDK